MKDLTQELVRELLHYDPDTGVFTWRERDRSWFKTERSWKVWNTRFALKETGSITINKLGYTRLRIRLPGGPRFAHRVAWLYMKGHPIPKEIDHINRDATDNRWCNLRDGEGVNSKNVSKYSSNSSGVSGVVWHKRIGKWQARGTKDGKRIHLGYFAYDDLDLAAMAVLEFRAEHGFDPSHGLELAHYHQAIHAPAA